MVEFDEIDMGAMVWVTGHPDDRTETLGFDELVELVERFLAGPWGVEARRLPRLRGALTPPERLRALTPRERVELLDAIADRWS